jgi:hypothetical protein
VFENRVLRNLCFDFREGKKQQAEKVQSEEFHSLYSPPDTGRMMKSWYIRWARHVSHIGRKRKAVKLCP